MRVVLMMAAAAVLQACVMQQADPAYADTAPATQEAQHLDILFVNSETTVFSDDEKTYIRGVLAESERAVRRLLPQLDKRVTIDVKMIDHDLDIVGGVTGMAEMPGKVTFLVSSQYPGGVMAAADHGLRYASFHEFHHLERGWTIRNNAFGRGIDIAVVNEGLADVFAETYSGRTSPSLAYPPEVGAWAAEILTLPRDADYNTWMNQHPDGRTALGYKTGRYLVFQAIEKSGKTILELSDLPVAEIWRLAGFPYERA